MIILLVIKSILSIVASGSGIGAGGDIGSGEYILSTIKNIYYFILLRLRIIMPYWYEMPTKVAIESGRAKTKESKTAHSITMTISMWSLVEQIKNKRGLKNLNEAIYFCAYHTAQDEELEP